MFKDRIAKGVELLDERGPEGWRERVNPDLLDQHDPEKCVLGQLYGNYWNGLSKIGLKVYDLEGLTDWFSTEANIAAHGFFLPTGEDWHYGTLTNEWKAALR